MAENEGSRRECRFRAGSKFSGHGQVREAGPGLAAEAEGLDELGVALFGGVPEIIQMAAALGDGAEETTAGRKVFLIGGEVGREVQDALGEGGGLIVGTAGVLVVELIVFEIDVWIYSDAAHVI